MTNSSVYAYGANSYVEYDSTPVGTVLDIQAHVINYGETPVFNVKIIVDGIEYPVEVPAEGLAQNTEALVTVQYAVQESNLMDPGNGTQIPVLVSFDDHSDGTSVTLGGSQLGVNIRSKPTEYALYFRFWASDYSALYTPSPFGIEVKKGYDGVPFIVSEDVTVTRSDDYTFTLKSLPAGYSIVPGTETNYANVPGFAEGDGRTLDFFVVGPAPEPPAPTGDDFMDMALARQTVGQPWSWS